MSPHDDLPSLDETPCPTLRATRWELPSGEIALRGRPLLMGILNITPDSFSDGGKYLDPGVAVDHALQLVAEGADLLDIGGESTRPYATPITAEEELRRVVPVVAALSQRTRVPLSIDTSKASVARAALDAGAQIVNDITALTGDPAMLPLVAESRAAVCLMHMQGTPQTMQDAPHYDSVVDEVSQYLAARRDALLAAGVPIERIALDPGIGFGKTHDHNLALLRHCHRLHTLGCPLLVGHSRKGFIGQLLGDLQADRSAGTLGVSLALACQGVQILRLHDIGTTRQAMTLFAAAQSRDV